MRRILVVVGLLLGLPAPTWATTYYVSKSGSDGNSCPTVSSQGLADQTKNKLTVDGGISCLASGDTLLIHTGTYVEAIDTTIRRPIPSGGSWATKTRIAAFPNGCSNPGCETVTLRPDNFAAGVPTGGTGYVVRLSSAYIPQFIEFDGIGMDGTLVDHFTFRMDANPSTGGDHIRVQYCTIIGPPGTGASAANGNATTMTIYKDAGNETGGGFNEILHNTIHAGGHASTNQDHAIYLATDNNVIDGNTIDLATGGGIHVWNENTFEGLMATGPTNNILRNNLILNGAAGSSAGWGILTGTDTNTLVYNNIIYNIQKTGAGSAGIAVYFSTNALVYNNTIDGGALTGIDVSNLSTGTVLRNNISWANAGLSYSDAGASTTCSNSVFTAGYSGVCGSTSTTNPGLINPAGGNFTFGAGSVARNTGFTVAAVTTDYYGTPRPKEVVYDIGAYEYFVADPNVVGSGCAGSSDGQNVTVGPVNMTGATFLAIALHSYGGNPQPTISSAPVNTWVAGGVSQSSINAARSQVYVASLPTVSGAMTLSATGASNSFPSICVIGFNTPATAVVVDRESGNDSGASFPATLQPGSITPTANGELVVTAITTGPDATAVALSGMTLVAQVPWVNGLSMGGGIGYVVQGTATPINPTWSITMSPADASSAARLVAFGPASAPPGLTVQRFRFIKIP